MSVKLLAIFSALTCLCRGADQPTATSQSFSIACTSVLPGQTSPPAPTVAEVVSREAREACKALHPQPAGVVGNATLEAFALYGGSSLKGDPDPFVCQDAVSQIAKQCFQFFYGGQASNKDFIFNMTNLRGAQDPLLGSSSTAATSTFTIPCAPTLSGLSASCPSKPYVTTVTFGPTSATAKLPTTGTTKPGSSTSTTSATKPTMDTTKLGQDTSKTPQKSTTPSAESPTEIPTALPTEPSTEKGGEGLTISGFTSIPSPTLSENAKASATGTHAAAGLAALSSGLFNPFGDAAKIASGLAGAATIEDASLTSLTGGIAQAFQSASGAAEYIELTDFTKQSTQAVEAIKALDNPLKDTLQKLKTLLESLAQVVKNKATRKDSFKRWYVLFLAEEASIGVLRKSFDALVVPSKPSSTSATSTLGKPTVTKTSSSATSTATAPVAPYVIHTKDGTSLGSFKIFIEALDESAGQLYHIPQTSFQLYITQLNTTQVALVKANPIVESVEPNKKMTGDFARSIPKRQTKIISKRDDYTSQRDSPDFLQLISQTKDGQGTPNPLADYRYNNKAGEGSFVYVVDGGVSDSSQSKNEFRLPSGFFDESNRLNLWWTASAKDNTGRGSDNGLYGIKDTKGHGTKVASVAVGTKHGVAKKATLIPVKYNDGDILNDSALQAALAWVCNDIETKGRKGKSVINLSLADFQSNLFSKYFKALWQQGNVVVIAAGNRGIGDKNNNWTPKGLHEQWPQTLGEDDNELITAGGCYNDGTLWPYTCWDDGYGGSITAYAQADNIPCMNQDGQEVIDEGTSLSAGMMSGLVGYFQTLPGLELPETKDRTLVLAVKDTVKRLSYARSKEILGDKGPKPGPKKGDIPHDAILPKHPPNVIFNNVPIQCGSDGAKAKRDGSCPVTSKPSTTPTPTPTPTTTPAPPPATTSKARKCDIDCGSELIPNHQPICWCYCDDRTSFRLTNNAACK